jgi:hypothetical protein
MPLFKCLLFASLVFQTLPAAHGEAHCPGSVASLTLRLVQDALIVVPIEINHLSARSATLEHNQRPRLPKNVPILVDI